MKDILFTSGLIINFLIGIGGLAVALGRQKRDDRNRKQDNLETFKNKTSEDVQELDRKVAVLESQTANLEDIKKRVYENTPRDSQPINEP